MLCSSARSRWHALQQCRIAFSAHCQCARSLTLNVQGATSASQSVGIVIRRSPRCLWISRRCRTSLPSQWFWSNLQSDQDIVLKVMACQLQRSASRLPWHTLAFAFRNSALCVCSAVVMPATPRLLPALRRASWCSRVCLHRRMLRAAPPSHSRMVMASAFRVSARCSAAGVPSCGWVSRRFAAGAIRGTPTSQMTNTMILLAAISRRRASA